jgi:hypothetical protein
VVAFQGRVEARFAVPTGGAAASVSSGALSSAVTVTTPAANYFHTSAGGVSSWATTFQTQLNNNVQGVPQASSAIEAALGYGGSWASGSAWLCNESSGNLAPTLGATTLTATSLTYGNTGALGLSTATSIGFSAGASRADGGNIHDVTATDDLVVMWIGYVPSVPAGLRTFITKMGAAGAGWQVNIDNGSQSFYFQGADAGSTLFTNIGASLHVGVWHVGIACLDRGTGKARIGTRAIASGSSSVVAESAVAAASMSNALAFRIGDRSDNPGVAPTGVLVDAAYVVSGSGVASGLSANLSSALSTFASAVLSAFTVSLSTTTGRYTISNSFWPIDIAWTSTDQRDLAGFEYDVTYPQTAAQMAAALGYGTWTDGAGYLCNESSGNLAAVFGTPATLTAAATPTYSSLGARGGSDKAIGFDGVGDAFTGSASSFDISASADLAFVLVAKFSTVTGNSDILGKGWGAGAAYVVVRETSNVALYVRDGVDQVKVDVPIAANTWYVIVGVAERAANTARIGVCAIGGSPSVSSASSISLVGTMSNGTVFSLGENAVYGASAGSGTISALYVATGSGVATGLSANLSTALSNFATYMKSQTGTEQAEGLFIPDCPITLQGNPSQAPRVTDLRQSEGPTGIVLGLAGNSKYRHRGIAWTAVPRSQVWESDATYANGSWQRFLDTTQFGMGHAWFTPSSRVQIYWDNAGSVEAIGAEHNSGAGVSGWYIKGITSCEPPLTSPPWTGLYRIEIPEIVSDG